MILESLFFLAQLVTGACYTGYGIDSISLYPTRSTLQNDVLVPLANNPDRFLFHFLYHFYTLLDLSVAVALLSGSYRWNGQTYFTNKPVYNHNSANFDYWLYPRNCESSDCEWWVCVNFQSDAEPGMRNDFRNISS